MSSLEEQNRYYRSISDSILRQVWQAVDRGLSTDPGPSYSAVRAVPYTPTFFNQDPSVYDPFPAPRGKGMSGGVAVFKEAVLGPQIEGGSAKKFIEKHAKKAVRAVKAKAVKSAKEAVDQLKPLAKKAAADVGKKLVDIATQHLGDASHALKHAVGSDKVAPSVAAEEGAGKRKRGRPRKAEGGMYRHLEGESGGSFGSFIKKAGRTLKKGVSSVEKIAAPIVAPIIKDVVSKQGKQLLQNAIQKISSPAVVEAAAEGAGKRKKKAAGAYQKRLGELMKSGMSLKEAHAKLQSEK